MSDTILEKRFPNLGKLSLALIEHLVKPIIGEDAIKEIKSPVIDKDLLNTLARILENTEKRLVSGYKDAEVCAAILGLPLASLPLVKQGAIAFINRPTDPAFGKILKEQLGTTFVHFTKDQIDAGVQEYQRVFLEELVNLSSEAREKISTLATLKIKETVEQLARNIENIVEQKSNYEQDTTTGSIFFGVGELPRFYVVRKAEIERLRSALSGSNGVALTAIAGMGGIGKSVLARSLANDPVCTELYPDGVLWAQLGPDATDETSADRVLLEWGFALNKFETLKSIPDTKAKADVLAYTLQKRRVLLVIDDVWHSTPAQLLAHVRGPNCGLLITTRLSKIPVAMDLDSIVLGGLQPDEALSLLSTRLGKDEVNKNLSLAQELVKRLGYHPLAIQLASAQLSISGKNWERLLLLLRRSSATSSSVDLEQNDRQKSLQACFNLSYTNLDKNCQSHYRRLGVMAPESLFGFDDVKLLWLPTAAEEAFDNIADATEKLFDFLIQLEKNNETYNNSIYDTLQKLIDAALVEEIMIDGSTYYRQHLLIREDALSRMSAEERKNTLELHAAYYHEIAHKNDEKGDYQQIIRSYPQIEALLRRSWRAWQNQDDWIGNGLSYSQEDTSLLIYCLIEHCIRGYWELKGNYAEQLLWARRANYIANQTKDSWQIINSLQNMGNAYSELGQTDAALRCYEEGINISTESSDETSYANYLGEIGMTYKKLGQGDKAIKQLKKALKIYKRLKSDSNLSSTISNIGTVYCDVLNQPDRAIKYFKQALKISREFGYHENECIQLGNLGRANFLLGKEKESLYFYEEAVKLAQENKLYNHLMDSLEYLGTYFLKTENITKAIEYYNRALELSREFEAPKTQIKYLSYLGLAYGKSEKSEQPHAIEHYNEALRISKEIGDKYAEIGILNDLGAEYLSQDKVASGLAQLQLSLALAHELGDQGASLSALENLGRAHKGIKQIDLAIENYKKALQTALSIGNRLRAVQILIEVGDLYREIKKTKKAIQYYKQVLSICKTTENAKTINDTMLHVGVIFCDDLDKYNLAIECFELALPAAHKLQDLQSESMLFHNLGVAHSKNIEIEQALNSFKQSLEISLRIDNKELTGNNLLNLGLLFKVLNDTQKTQELFELALSIFEEIDSPLVEKARQLLTEK